MPFLDSKPDPFHRGQMKLSARDLNMIVQAVTRQVRGSQGIQVEDYGDRTTISSKPLWPNLQRISNYIHQFVVREERDDYLVCTPFEQPITVDEANWIPQIYDATLDANSTTLMAVAKPYVLQKTSFEGATVNLNGQNVKYEYGTLPTGTRRAFNPTTPTETEYQVIVPGYFSGDVIVAVKLVSGVRPEPGYTGDPNNFPIAWMDANFAGRAWALASTP